MKKSYFNTLKFERLLSFFCVLFISNKIVAQHVLDNGKLRFGNGIENSVNVIGTLDQPFYYNVTAGEWEKLTYSNYALNTAICIGGNGANEWNANGIASINGSQINQSIDYSQFVATVTPKGYGTVISKGQIIIDGSLLEIENTYKLEGSGFVEIRVKVINVSNLPVTNVRYWVGTADDWLGDTDQPGKIKGNIINGTFVPITNATTRSNAIKIFSGTEAVVIFTKSNHANTFVKPFGFNWGDIILLDPGTSEINVDSQDSAYGLYVRLNDLGVGESDEFTWYYCAGELDGISDIVKDMDANGLITAITDTTAKFTISSGTNVTGYYVVVPAGVNAPTANQIKGGIDYEGITIVANDSTFISSNSPVQFNITGLIPNTQYTLYYVTEDGSVTSGISSLNFTTEPLVHVPVDLTLVSKTDILCNGDGSGSATVSVSGGSPPYTYLWLPSGGTDVMASNLSPNNYSVAVTDAVGRTDSIDVIITEPVALNVEISKINASCNEISDGEASVVVTGGTGAYTYSWNTIPLQTTAIATGLRTGRYTVTVTDAYGCNTSKNVVVITEDAIAPTVITQDITVQLDTSGFTTITPAQINNGSTDNCGIATMSLNKTLFDCSNVGVNTVTLTVIDANGNSFQGTAIVAVQDNVLPTAITKDIAIQLDATGIATITPDMVDDGSTDNCGIATMSLNKTLFDCSNVGVNTVTLTVIDANGNSFQGTAIVTVQDNVLPTAITRDIAIQLDATGIATITPDMVDDGSTDNCGIATMSLNKTLFDCSNVGVNTVTLTVTDANGNSSQGTAIVTVQDNVLPTAITRDIAIQLDATGIATITPDMVDDGSTDNCGIATMSLNKTLFDCSNVGVNTVTLTVTDANGNSSQGTAIVTVEDILAPTITTHSTTLTLDATGYAILIIADIVDATIDNCSLRSVTLSKTAFNCSDIGINKITITAADIYDNISKQEVTVTVIDTIPPIVITQNIEVTLAANGKVTISPSMINNGSVDCAIDKMTLDIDTFDCADIGANTVTLTIIDKSGNISAAAALVTVLSLQTPTFSNIIQKFCAIDDPALADIMVTETNVQWFADAVSTKILSPNTRITNGTYYAAIRYGNCYSDRITVSIIINDSSAPTGNEIQYVCAEEDAIIAHLYTNEEDIIWYETPTGGVPLSAATVLEHKQKYYASYVGSGCESSKRLEVEVLARYCDVKIYNAVSANGDGKNDYFTIEGATTFPDSKLEIFNRWGSVVFKATNYGRDGNFFKGYANKGLGTTGALLPYGTYYYVFSFTNHDGESITKKGFLHLNH